MELVAESDEPIVEIAVREGTRVAAGQLLVRLDSGLYETRVAQARANRERADRRLAELVRGPRSERILEARARADGARENLATQRREHERVQSLVERNLVSSSELDRAYARRELAAAQFEEAQAGLSELLEGTTPEELAQAQAALDEADAGLASALISLSRLSVTSPRAGWVEALPFELGERPPKGAPVAVVLSDAQPYARVYVPEPIRARIAAGLDAIVRIDGIERSFAGRVRFLASDAAFTPYFALTQRDRSRLSYLAEIDLTETEAAELPTGIPVEVDFPSVQ
jgi:HlyD family secretion protein